MLARSAVNVSEDIGDGPNAPFSWIGLVWKNALAAALVLGVMTALATGYFSPDRPTRPQWERLEKLKSAKGGREVYRSNFAGETPGQSRDGIAEWGYYNGATASTVQYGPSGVTVIYGGTAWIGAQLRLLKFVPGAIYRVTLERTVEGSPGALIVRNRQMDLMRKQIPVGSGTFSTEFVAPRGALDRVIFAFIADGRSRPQGKMQISSLTIERLGE